MLKKNIKNILSSLIIWLFSLSVFLTLALGIAMIVFLFTFSLTFVTLEADTQNNVVNEIYKNYEDFFNISTLYLIRWIVFNIVIIVVYDLYLVIKKKLPSISIQWLIKRDLILKSLWIANSSVLFINAHISYNSNLYEKLPGSVDEILEKFSAEIIRFLIFVFIPIYGGLYCLVLKVIEFIVGKIRKGKKIL